MSPRNGPLALAFIVCVSFSAAPAVADEAAETFLRSWVASIDALPGFRATVRGIASDAGTDTTTVSGLAIASEPPGFSATADTIAVAAFVPTTDGAFGAGSVRIEGATIGGSGFARVEIATAEFRDFRLPAGAGFVWDENRPFVSFIKALSPLAKVEMTTGRIASVILFQTVDNVESRISYEQVNIDGWSGGRIAAIGAGPISSQSPDVDQLTAMTIASAQTRDVDLGAFFAVYDPDNYVNGMGDMVWRQVVGKTTYRDMIAAVPGITFTMKEATLEGFKLRQPKNGIGILATLGTPGAAEMSDDPVEALKLLELLTSYGFGAFTMRDMEVKAPGIRDATIAGLSFTDFSSDVLGEFALDRLAVSIEEQGSVSIRRFAFGDLVPPALEAFIAAVAAQESGREVDVASVVPTLGFIEATGVDMAIADIPRTTLERFRLDLRDYVGPVPTTVALDLVDADVDAALIEDPQASKMLADLGYDRVILDAALRARWTNSGDIIFDSFAFGMKDVGEISGDVTFRGIRPTEYMDLSDETALEKLSFVRGTVTAKDDSIVGRGLALQAQELGVDPEAFREQFAMGLPFMLAFLGDPRLQAELAPVLQQFIKTAGGSITMVANPASPQPLMLLAMMAAESPFELAKALNVTFSGLPGVTSPPAEVAEPEPETPAEPAVEPEPAPAPEEPAVEPEPAPAPDGKNPAKD